MMTKELRNSIAGGLACMLVLLAFAPGCTKIPNGGIPIYLAVDSPTVISSGFGSDAFRIPDVWAYCGSQDLGAYQTPVKIPILSQGEVVMALSAGIYDNGIINSRAQYPFYRPDTFTIHDAVPGKTYVHHPVYRYYADTRMPLNATFEAGNGFNGLSIAGGDDADGVPGGHCGAITLAAADTGKVVLQSPGMVINTHGRQAYMEFQYKKSNVNDTIIFDVGIEYKDASGNIQDYTLITIPPQDVWKKTYLNFSNTVGSNPNDLFQVYFIVYKNPGQANTVYFDNIKFLYFD